MVSIRSREVVVRLSQADKVRPVRVHLVRPSLLGHLCDRAFQLVQGRPVSLNKQFWGMNGFVQIKKDLKHTFFRPRPFESGNSVSALRETEMRSKHSAARIAYRQPWISAFSFDARFALGPLHSVQSRWSLLHFSIKTTRWEREEGKRKDKNQYSISATKTHRKYFWSTKQK